MLASKPRKNQYFAFNIVASWVNVAPTAFWSLLHRSRSRRAGTARQTANSRLHFTTPGSPTDCANGKEKNRWKDVRVKSP
jgi:hypothetical protein